MSELPNKKELEEAANNYPVENGWTSPAFISGAHYQHPISYAKGLQDAIDLLMDTAGAYDEYDSADYIRRNYAEELKILEVLNDERRV